MRSRAGVTLPELVLVAWLFALVLLALARFAGAQGRIAATTHDRVRAADLVRTTELVLGGELRHAAPADLSVTPDSIRLRAVRGVGVICGRVGTAVLVRYRGVRSPDPEKDSALVITGAGTTGAAYRVTGVVTDRGCGDGYRLTLDPTPPPAGLTLIFETGSYHLSGGAFRYRRGRGGRQPVTEAVLAPSRFRTGEGSIAARLRLHPDSLPRLSRRSLAASVRRLNPVMPAP